jgi:hypothetical protein
MALSFATISVLSTATARAAELGPTATRRTIEQLVHQSYPDLIFGNIACPDGIAKERGVKFTCIVQLPGTFLVVDAVQTDGKGTVSVTSPQAVIAKAPLEQFVATNASLPAAVDCGPAPWHAVRPGQTVVCTANLADGTARDVELTVQDTAGTVTITGVT